MGKNMFYICKTTKGSSKGLGGSVWSNF